MTPTSDRNAASRPSRNRNPSSAKSTAPVQLLAFLNGNVITMNEARPRAEAFVVGDGRFLHVGTSAEARLFLKAHGGGRERSVDLGGATIVPGLTDCHVHLMNLGGTVLLPDLCTVSSDRGLVEAVARRAREIPEGEWIVGFGWNETGWSERQLPGLKEMDAASPSNPVLLTRIDGHAAIANSLALKAAGIAEGTPDPRGGKFLRDPITGELSGVLIDTACDVVREHIPRPTKERKREMLEAALDRLANEGLTSVHDAWTELDVLELLFELEDEGTLPLRIHSIVPGREELLEGLSPIESVSRSSSDWVSARAVKLLADGALGSRGALLTEPYRDAPDSRGIAIMTEREMATTICNALRLGLQPVIHAIGDAMNKAALDAYEKCLAGGLSVSTRPRIEHAQVLLPSDVSRFAALGITVSIQPAQLMSDMAWMEERLGPQRIRNCFMWQSLLKKGTRLISGSDCPIESPNPFLGIYAAVTRKNESGEPEGGWFPEECLTREQALATYTLDAAYAGFRENVCGSIVQGKAADFTVIDRDLLSVPPEELLLTRVLATVVEGRQTAGSLTL
jgi:predicted amidohydrolase YtcJ